MVDGWFTRAFWYDVSFRDAYVSLLINGKKMSKIYLVDSKHQ